MQTITWNSENLSDVCMTLYKFLKINFFLIHLCEMWRRFRLCTRPCYIGDFLNLNGMCYKNWLIMYGEVIIV